MNYHDLIKEVADKGLPKDEIHYYNCHFPGLYSIALKRGGGLHGDEFYRIFVAKPGCLHPNLQLINSRFLWHDHSYHLHETCIIGKIINIKVEPTIMNDGDSFCEYRIDQNGYLTRLSLIRLKEYKTEVCGEGESFEMNHKEIHRVVFLPNEHGWFASLVEESGHINKTKLCYSKHSTILNRIPDFDNLYIPITREHAQEVVKELVKFF